MKLTSALESVYAENGIVDPSVAPVTAEFTQVVGDVVSGQELARCEARQTSTSEEAAELVRGEQTLQEVHEHINATAVDGQVSLEAYVFAKHALCTTRLGRSMELPIGPSLESIDNDGPVTVSQEAIGDLVKNLGELSKNGIKRYMAESHRAASFLTGVLGARRRQIAALGKQLTELSGDATGKKVSIGQRFLTRNGTVINAGNAVAYARECFATLNYCTQQFLEDADKATESNALLIDAINPETDATFQAGLKALVRGWKDPRAKLLKGGKQAPMPSDIPLFEDRASRYEGTNPSLKFLDDQTNKHRFTHLILESNDQKKNGSDQKFFQKTQQVDALSKKQMQDLVGILSGSLSSIDRGMVFTQELSSPLRSAGGLAMDAGRFFSQLAKNGAGFLAKTLPFTVKGKGHAAEFKVIQDAFAHTSVMGNMLFFDASALACRTSLALIKYMRASIAAHGGK